MKTDIENAIKVLKTGGTILYPTDTVWGIGCDATHAGAVKCIYNLKQRHDALAMLILIDHPGRLQQYVSQVPEIAWQLVEVADKPLTIIYPSAKNLAENLLAEDGSVGIRIVKDAFCMELIRRFNKPLVSTSANFSGETAPAIFDEIHPEIISGVDYVVHWRQDDLSRSQPSGIIKLGINGEIKIIRE
ncbi:MAG: threonylcarbamoyl-AMP synthase [Bacteroidales bacterium]|nr:threonylcarbamoyl-AMP synthase [Bacteroidales bacterium]